MKIRSIIFLLIFCVPLLTAAVPDIVEKQSGNIPAAVEKIADGAGADVGVAYASSGKYRQNGSRQDPLLSVFFHKLHVAVAVLDRADRENIALDSRIQILSAEIKPDLYSPLREKYGVRDLSLPLRELLRYMVAESDNNACDILIRWLGGVKKVAAYSRKIGLRQTEILVTETEMNRNVRLQYANKAPLSEIIRLLQLIDGGKLFAPELHKELLAIMEKTSTGTDKIKKYLPSFVSVAHKTGSSSRLTDGKKIADNDVAIIKSGNNVWYLAVMVADSRLSDKENAEIIARIAFLIYKTEINGKISGKTPEN